jgi:hypothetical protein
MGLGCLMIKIMVHGENGFQTLKQTQLPNHNATHFNHLEEFSQIDFSIKH